MSPRRTVTLILTVFALLGGLLSVSPALASSSSTTNGGAAVARSDGPVVGQTTEPAIHRSCRRKHGPRYCWVHRQIRRFRHHQIGRVNPPKTYKLNRHNWNKVVSAYRRWIARRTAEPPLVALGKMSPKARAIHDSCGWNPKCWARSVYYVVSSCSSRYISYYNVTCGWRRAPRWYKKTLVVCGGSAIIAGAAGAVGGPMGVVIGVGSGGGSCFWGSFWTHQHRWFASPQHSQSRVGYGT